MRKRILNVLAFGLTVAFVAVVLKVANWLPTAIEQGMLRRYDSVEEARSKLNVKGILVPSYFPSNLSWPPSVILAQTKPFTAVVMECRDREKGDTAIVISQAASADFSASSRIRMLQVREKVAYPLKGRNALLAVGLCGNGAQCSRISWKEGKMSVSISMSAPPFELIKIAESMVQ